MEPRRYYCTRFYFYADRAAAIPTRLADLERDVRNTYPTEVATVKFARTKIARWNLHFPSVTNLVDTVSSWNQKRNLWKRVGVTAPFLWLEW